MQRVIEADVLNPTTTPTARAQLARAWDVLEERKRILRGKPLPGSLKPEKPKPSGPSYNDPRFAEPIEE